MKYLILYHQNQIDS